MTTTSTNLDTGVGSGSPQTLVPEQYPPLMPQPRRTWRPHWTAVPFLLPLVIMKPRWMSGPIGAGSLWSALVAHLVSWICLILSSAMIAGLGEYLFDGSAVQATGQRLSYLQAVAAGVVEMWLSMMLAFRLWSDVFEIAVVVVLFELCFVGMAIVLVPWIARGEARWRTWLRSLKVVLWATSGVCITPVVLLIIMSGMYFVLPLELTRGLGNLFEEILAALLSASTLIILWMLSRLGEHYCGPARGWLYEPRALRCRDCGYELAFLACSANCPECNLSVAQSLPKQRKKPAFDRAKRVWRQLQLYPMLWWRSLRGKRFGRQLRVFNAHREAWRFLGMTLIVIGSLGALAGVIGGELLSEWDWERYQMVVPVVYLLRLSIVATLTASSTGLFFLVFGWMLSGFGWHQPERVTTVAAYSSGWLVISAACVCVGVAFARFMFALDEWFPNEQYMILGERFTLNQLIAIAGFLPAVICFFVWCAHLSTLLKCTRYASA